MILGQVNSVMCFFEAKFNQSYASGLLKNTTADCDAFLSPIVLVLVAWVKENQAIMVRTSVALSWDAT